MEIWRIEDSQEKMRPKAKHGKFHDCDSCSVPNTTKHPGSGKLLHTIIHFRLGQATTADVMGTATSKVVELDDLLEGEPVQHRVVVGNESQAFLKLFPYISQARRRRVASQAEFVHLRTGMNTSQVSCMSGKSGAASGLNAITYNNVIRACEEAQRWHQALVPSGEDVAGLSMQQRWRRSRC